MSHAPEYLGADPELPPLLRLARDPNTPGTVLRQILNHPVVARVRRAAEDDPYVYTDYVGHQTDPPAAREAFLDQLEWALARHRNTPPELQAGLARGGRVAAAIVDNPSASPDVLDGLVHGSYGHQPGLRLRSVAAHPAAPPSALERIARTGAGETLERVLAHPHASPAARAAAEFLLGRAGASDLVLRAIVADGERNAVRAVAAYPATSARLLTDLVDIGEPDILALVAAHPNATDAVLRAVAATLARTYEADHQRNALHWTDGPAPDRYQRALVALRGHPACDEAVLAPLAQLLPLLDLTTQEKHNLAADPRTDPATLALLAGDLGRLTLEALAANPGTPPAVLDTLLLLHSDTIDNGLLRNPAARSDLLRRLFQRTTLADRHARLALARHPNTPPDVLERLGGWKDRDLRDALTRRPPAI